MSVTLQHEAYTATRSPRLALTFCCKLQYDFRVATNPSWADSSNKLHSKIALVIFLVQREYSSLEPISTSIHCDRHKTLLKKQIKRISV